MSFKANFLFRDQPVSIEVFESIHYSFETETPLDFDISKQFLLLENGEWHFNPNGSNEERAYWMEFMPLLLEEVKAHIKAP